MVSTVKPKPKYSYICHNCLALQRDLELFTLTTLADRRDYIIFPVIFVGVEPRLASLVNTHTYMGIYLKSLTPNSCVTSGTLLNFSELHFMKLK